MLRIFYHLLFSFLFQVVLYVEALWQVKAIIMHTGIKPDTVEQPGKNP